MTDFFTLPHNLIGPDSPVPRRVVVITELLRRIASDGQMGLVQPKDEGIIGPQGRMFTASSTIKGCRIDGVFHIKGDAYVLSLSLHTSPEADSLDIITRATALADIARRAPKFVQAESQEVMQFLTEVYGAP